MLLISILSLLLSNAVTIRRDISILFNRIAIIALTYSILHSTISLFLINKGIGLHGGLLNITNITQIFDIFIFFISILILQLTSFFPRKVWVPEHSSLTQLLFNNFVFYRTKIINKMGEHLRIIEYPLILLFIISGAIFLISTSDLISIFLAIELQSYGLYLLSTIYRNSELSTTGGLMYFLLGGLSSCFILLGSSLLYANSGTTNLDGLYAITSISDNLDFWYKPYYINFSLLIFSIGFLFKVSAAPFHFWSPRRELGKFSVVGSKLSNSGKPLEFQVPNYNWKVISGWVNNSCKVISLKASEKNEGNCGSKSVIRKNIIVKEQRVNGSWCGKRVLLGKFSQKGLNLFTLNLPNPSLISSFRLYSSLPDSSLNPWFITGFSDAEVCFTLSVSKRKENKIGWRIFYTFQITLHDKYRNMLELIQNYFGVGSITKHRTNSVHFRVESLEDLNKILDHFNKYPLMTKKWADFQLFKQALYLVKNKEHLTLEGVRKIVAIKASMNLGLSNELKAAFPDISPKKRPEVLLCKIKEPNWLSGFATGEGCFFISISKSSSTKSGFNVKLEFNLTQHNRDSVLLENIKEFFESGNIYKKGSSLVYKVTVFSELWNNIVPFFKTYPILGSKNLDFIYWMKAIEIIKNKEHLTEKGLDKIRSLKLGLNTGRVLDTTKI
uniref:NADH dehydrogenase subunit 2 n=1 Tax=Harringtonia lauricola TaxID=483707 RepID=UPI00292A3E74|nr:NADH dehydrogenase subunit 2 [Harringtonia lauricola]WNK75960.1 NADH dehydrogenase subunit 2 [Harringtonia lauricola]